MRYSYTERFHKAFRKLPPQIQNRTRTTLVRFLQDPNHPGLGIKRVQGTDGIWEGRITAYYRFTFHYEQDPETGEEICVLRNIGGHDIPHTAP